MKNQHGISALFQGATRIALGITLGVALVSTPKAHAGGMKDVQLSHLEALAEYLYGTFDISLLDVKNTVFVPAPAGFFIAVSSDVSVESSETGLFEWQTCTSYFEKISERSDDLEVTKVTCIKL